jgi:hypothetical protein
MSIETFTKQNLKELRRDLDTALGFVANMHGIKLSVGMITFLPDGFSAKLSGISNKVVESTGSLDAPIKWQTAFLSHSKEFGLTPGDLGRKFEYRGELVTLAGARPRARFPIVLKQSNGKFKAVSTISVINSLH